MNSEELKKLISQDEGPTLEFKRAIYLDKVPRSPKEQDIRALDNKRQGEFAKDIMALANTYSKWGYWRYLIIGVDDNKKLVGITPGALSEEVVQQVVQNHCNPPVDFHYTEIEFEGIWLGVFQIPDSPLKPHEFSKDVSYQKGKNTKLAFSKGDVLIRHGSHAQKAFPEEIGLLINESEKLRDDWAQRCDEEERRRELPRKAIVGLRFAAVSDVFKNRADEISQLHRLLGDQKVKLICIVGRGGIGKTALLCKVCEEIERGELRLSNTSATMGADGILYVSCCGTDKPTVERLYHDFCRVLGNPHEKELIDYWRDVSRSLADKVRFLFSKLQAGCYLLVLDNFEDTLAPD